MIGTKAVRFCIWGGIAAGLIGILIFGVGYVITATAPFYPYGPPRGAGIAWMGIITVVLGIGMTASGAIMKAVGVGAETEDQEQRASAFPDRQWSPGQGEGQDC